ncbi:hypothetical protein EDD11_010182 [Mortierella claussenii]|nr:hypothetical protein EDD11_010182 [Mortierella claussenii]
MFNVCWSNECSRPSIPVRIPNDDTTFNPKDYPNVVFKAKGRLAGKVLLVHGGPETDGTGLGLISTRIWVVRESDREQVHITPTFDDKTHTFSLQAPEDYHANSIYHETLIQYPSTLSSAESLSLSAPNTGIESTTLSSSLVFRSFKSVLSNGSISLNTLYTDTVNIHTTNGNISGAYQSGHVNFETTNGNISAKLNIVNAQDQQQSIVNTKTSNSSTDLHVTATETVRGLWMENWTRNGRLTVGALIGKADRASVVKVLTSNANIDFNLDASQTGQDLQVENKSSNGSIVSSIMVPKRKVMEGVAETSNASVSINLTEEFEGKFEVDTTNASTTVEGSDLTLYEDKKTSKRGYHLQNGPSKFKIRSSNGSASLRFYPSGESLASSEH